MGIWPVSSRSLPSDSSLVANFTKSQAVRRCSHAK